MIDRSNAYIPAGMYRSVEWNKPLQNPHPVEDASLTDAGAGRHVFPTSAAFAEIID
jgi:hypothetical protein